MGCFRRLNSGTEAAKEAAIRQFGPDQLESSGQYNMDSDEVVTVAIAAFIVIVSLCNKNKKEEETTVGHLSQFPVIQFFYRFCDPRR